MGMTREEAIKELKQFSGTTQLRLSANFWTAHNMAIKALEQTTWIPVSERLPEETIYKEFVDPSEPVLIQLNNGGMEVSRYWGSRESYKDKPWIDLSYPTTLKVIAWMPLPKPYEPQERESNK